MNEYSTKKVEMGVWVQSSQHSLFQFCLCYGQPVAFPAGDSIPSFYGNFSKTLIPWLLIHSSFDLFRFIKNFRQCVVPVSQEKVCENVLSWKPHGHRAATALLAVHFLARCLPLTLCSSHCQWKSWTSTFALKPKLPFWLVRNMRLPAAK